MTQLLNLSESRKAIESLNFDLNASAFGQTTSHADSYKFISIHLAFSTGESKTITLSATDGTNEIPLWKKTTDTATSRVLIPDKDWSYPADWELKLDITQTSGACLADILVLTKSP